MLFNNLWYRLNIWIDSDPETGENDLIDRLVSGLKEHPVRNGLALLVLAAVVLKVFLVVATVAAILDQP